MAVIIIEKATLNDGTYAEIIDIDSSGSALYITYRQIILVLADGSGFSVGSDISGDSVGGNDGVGVVRQKIDVNTVVVEVVSGTFVSGNAVDDAAVYAAPVTTISSKTQSLKVKRTTVTNSDDQIGTYV